MVYGLTPFRAVFWAIVAAMAMSFVMRDAVLGPRRLARALSDGG